MSDYIFIAFPKKMTVKETVITKYEIYCEDEDLLFSSFQKPGQVRITDRHFAEFIKEIREIIGCINIIKSDFDDLVERQVHLVELKTRLVSLRNKLTLAHHNFLRFVNICIDSLENIRSESMNTEQISALESVFTLVFEDIEDFEVDSLQVILIKSGLKPIPDLEGIAELY